VSDHRRSSRNLMAGENGQEMDQGDPHHPEYIRQHSEIVMSKLHLFNDMAQVVGQM
jgi:hypothetical protein